MRIPALLLSLHALAAAQSVTTTIGQPGSTGAAKSPIAAELAKPEDLCAISGRVSDILTGEPLARASIILMRADTAPSEMVPPTTYTTSSNADGKFAMKDIEPGRYRLSANRNGYVRLIFGALGLQRPGTAISLVRQQRMTDLTLKLTPQAVLAGRIVDDQGEPLVNARVALQSYQYVEGRKRLTMVGGMTGTKDLGEYRIFGVSPGKYYLSAMPLPMFPSFAIDRSVIAAEEDYVATYYPGAFDPASASQIDVAAGAQLRGLDMVLSRVRTVQVKGRVTHGLGRRQGVDVMLTPRNPDSFQAMRRTLADAAGNFNFRNVTPGAYTVLAEVNDGVSARHARIPVDVGGSTVEGLNITIGAGANVKGRVRSDADAEPVDLSAVRFSLPARDPNVSERRTASLAQDGTFEVKDVSPGRYNLIAVGLPASAYLKSARSGDVDVLASGLDLTSAAPVTLDIVISPHGATVSGTVQNPKTGEPAPGALVVLVPQETDRREQQIYYKNVPSDQHGAFIITGVMPGDYKIYAWEDIESGAYMDPDFLKPVEKKGEAATLREGDQKTVPLKMIAVDSPGAPN